MAQPPSYEASQNPGYQPVYNQGGAYPPPTAGGAYPPPPAGGAYPPPPQGGAYPPPQQPVQQPYVYPGKQEPGADVEYQGHTDDGDKGMMGIISFDERSVRLSKFMNFKNGLFSIKFDYKIISKGDIQSN